MRPAPVTDLPFTETPLRAVGPLDHSDLLDAGVMAGSPGRLAARRHTDRPTVATPEDADRLVRPALVGLDRERCLLLSLDARNRLLAVDVVSIGSVDHTFMSPREVFRDALLRGAAAIVLAHNHPSGDHSDSAADRAITRRLAAAGATLGVTLNDHLVVGDHDFTSLARKGCT